MILAARLACLWALMALGVLAIRSLWYLLGYTPTFELREYIYTLIDMGVFAFGYWYIYHDREPYGITQRRRSSPRG